MMKRVRVVAALAAAGTMCMMFTACGMEKKVAEDHMVTVQVVEAETAAVKNSDVKAEGLPTAVFACPAPEEEDRVKEADAKTEDAAVAETVEVEAAVAETVEVEAAAGEEEAAEENVVAGTEEAAEAADEAEAAENVSSEEETTEATASDWKADFEARLLEEYDVTVDHYVDLGDGLYDVYVVYEGEVVRYVCVDSKTGYFHG